MCEYRYVATSVTGFVQQLAVQYFGHGYKFYIRGQVPPGKDPEAVDRRLIDLYDIRKSPGQRARRKARGEANLQYLRHGRDWVIVATEGKHQSWCSKENRAVSFWDEESANIRDVRECPFQFEGYSIRVVRGQYVQEAGTAKRKSTWVPGKKREKTKQRKPYTDRKYRVRVQIADEEYLSLKAELLSLARKRSWTSERIAARFWAIPLEPYAPVRKQLLQILRQVNKARRLAGMPKISPSVLRLRRKIVRVFELEKQAA